MQLHESMNVALCLIEDGEWAKAGSTADYLYHSHRLARDGTNRENWLLSGGLTNECPPEAQRQHGGTSRYHADPWGRCGTANMEESMMYQEESMMYPGSVQSQK